MADPLEVYAEDGWEWAVFELVDRSLRLCGRPYYNEDSCEIFMQYLKEQNPGRSFVKRRRKVGAWSVPKSNRFKSVNR